MKVDATTQDGLPCSLPSGQLIVAGGSPSILRLDLADPRGLQLRSKVDKSMRRLARYAETGVDEDFHRGETRFERYVSARFGDGTGVNRLLRALDTEGTLYATILGPGLLDTKGGPRTDVAGRVLDVRGRPIPGLYAVGNAAASPTGQGYAGAGGTLGPIITAGYLAVLAIAESKKVTAQSDHVLGLPAGHA